MKTAVVILNWNGRKLLEQFLPSITAYSGGADIWVADNNSSDDSINFLKLHHPNVKLVQNRANYGFAGGYNEALKQVEADVYVLVNSDIEVTPGWLDAPLEMLRDEPGTAIVQPKIRDYKDREYFEYAGAAGGFIDSYGYPFCRGRLFDTVEKDLGQYDNDCEILWASGACFFIRKSVFDSLGGFDADFFVHQEEIDLCWRAFNSGHAIKYAAGSTVFHIGGATLNEANPKKTYLNFRNSLLMLLKNLPAKKLFPVLMTRLLLDGVAGFRFFVQGKFAHCAAVVRAHFAFYKLFRINRLKRKSLQKQNYFKLKNVVYTYFIEGKRRFSDLF